MTIKNIIIKYLIVALAAFVLGTFFPNPVAKNKTQGETIAWVKKMGFGTPIALAKTLDNFSTNKEYEKHVIDVIRNLRNGTK
jgi:hypothetical protein